MCDRVRPITEPEEGQNQPRFTSRIPDTYMGKKLYVKVPSQNSPWLRKIRNLLNMFPGKEQVILFCADTRKQLGARAALHPAMLDQLREWLGEEAVVLK